MPEKSSIDKFYGGKFNGLISKGKWFIFAIIAIWSIFSCVMATQLGPLTKEEEWLPDDHWVSRAFKILGEGYFSGDQDESITMELFWGVDKVD